jgi:O-antigen ligase
MHFLMCGVTILLAIVLGGGTHSGFYGDVAVQLIAIPLLLASLWPVFALNHPRRRAARLASAICLACAAIILVQIVPFPLDVWSGGSPLFSFSNTITVAASKSKWASLSITPQATWAAAASLIVPLSVFASVLQLGLRQRMALCWMILGLGAISLLLGFLQATQGPSGDWRFYEYTNPTEAVGFFANRNHFAAFLNVVLIASALWFYPAIQASLQDKTLNTRAILWSCAAAGFLVATVAGLAVARSRAGVILMMAALAGIVMMVVAKRFHDAEGDLQLHRHTRRVSLAVTLFAVFFVLQFGLGGVASRLENSISDDLRIPLTRTTFQTAFKAMPLGTGLGSFVSVYATVEKPQDALVAYANRAHNDLAELFLETGLMGMIILIFFLAWFARKAFAIWMRSPADALPSQGLLERASTLVIAILLLHSLVDYPLRTTALSAVFAFFCAALLVPFEVSKSEAPRNKHRKHRTRRPGALPALIPSPDVKWPEAWQTPDNNL